MHCMNSLHIERKNAVEETQHGSPLREDDGLRIADLFRTAFPCWPWAAANASQCWQPRCAASQRSPCACGPTRLNLAPYGGNIEGVGAASLIYFHKRAQRLPLAEVLTLAVIPQNPRKRGGAARAGELAGARHRLWQMWLARHPEALPSQPDIAAAPLLASACNLPFLAPHLTDRVLRGRHTAAYW
ncbi:MAG: pbpC [Massilia sp.]|nr:pbpC [Massilia sp.]